MATIRQDTFVEGSDVDLQNHIPTPSGAGSWTVTDSLAYDVIAATDVVRSTVGTGAGKKAASEETDVGDDQMDVTLTVTAIGATGVGIWVEGGPVGRIPTAVANTGYGWLWRQTGTFTTPASRWEYVKWDAGTETVLASWATAPAANDIAKNEIRDGTKKGYVNGTERASTTNNDITGNNFAGMFADRNGTTTWDADDFLSESVAGVAPDVQQFMVAVNQQMRSGLTYSRMMV